MKNNKIVLIKKIVNLIEENDKLLSDIKNYNNNNNNKTLLIKEYNNEISKLQNEINKLINENLKHKKATTTLNIKQRQHIEKELPVFLCIIIRSCILKYLSNPILIRKCNKLMKKPRLFFYDSKYICLKLIYYLFYRR